MEVAVLQGPPSEKRLAAALQHRFYLRIHMAAMLTATLLAGLIVTRLLLAAGVGNFAVRYGIAVVVAYLVFITSVKLWLAYIGFCAVVARRRSGTTGADWFDCLNLSSGGSSSWSGSSSTSSVSEGGGKFGGGASGSWGEGAGRSNLIAAAAVPPQPAKKSDGCGLAEDRRRSAREARSHRDARQLGRERGQEDDDPVSTHPDAGDSRGMVGAESLSGSDAARRGSPLCESLVLAF